MLLTQTIILIATDRTTDFFINSNVIVEKVKIPQIIDKNISDKIHDIVSNDCLSFLVVRGYRGTLVRSAVMFLSYSLPFVRSEPATSDIRIYRGF